MLDPKSITVLTTAERRDAFAAELGHGIDIVDDCRKSNPLNHFMFNVAVGAGGVLVIDEAHFPVAADLARGIAMFLDCDFRAAKRLRIIVVCNERAPGDPLLTFLAAYCQIHDIVYSCSLIQAIARVAHLIEHPNTRIDCLPLLQAVPASAASFDATTTVQVGEKTYCLASGERLSLNVDMELLGASSVARPVGRSKPLFSICVEPGGVAC